MRGPIPTRCCGHRTGRPDSCQLSRIGRGFRAVLQRRLGVSVSLAVALHGDQRLGDIYRAGGSCGKTKAIVSGIRKKSGPAQR